MTTIERKMNINVLVEYVNTCLFSLHVPQDYVCCNCGKADMLARARNEIRKESRLYECS